MKRCVSLALVAGLLAWTGAAVAEEAYTIKRKESAVGDTVQVERTNTLKVVTLLVAKGTKVINETDTAVETSAYKETVLERDGAKKPTKLERVYTKAQVTVGGQKPVELTYHDKTVVIEKKGDRYTFTYKGAKELQPGEAQFLDKEFNSTPAERGELGKLPVPPGAVKVDEEWKLDLPMLLEPLEKGDAGFDPAKATGTGKLVKVYKKDDKTFGELRYAVKVPLTSFGQGKQKMSVKDGSSASYEVTQDVCIDSTADSGVVRSKMELSAKGTVPTPQGDGDFTVTMLHEVQETRKDLKK
jgi:hypothetical protein